MRQLGPIRAVFSNLLGLGLGYVYVGRIQLAFAYIGIIVGLIAVAGWSRFVFHPSALYVFAAIAACVTLFVLIHCWLIAARNRTAVAHSYNRWWFYVLWLVISWFVSQGIILSRPVVFGFEPFSIPSNSMAPVLQGGDYVMTDTWYFDHANPQYGDFVVFRVPGNVGVKYVKRVVGLPGDRIEIRNDVLIRNGQTIDEPFIQLTPQGPSSSRNFGPVTTPSDSYFVLGDNRHRSRDSRYIGPIDGSLLHGRVVHRWFAYRGEVLWDRFPEMLGSYGD